MVRCTFWRIKECFAVIFFLRCPIRQNSMPKFSRRKRNETHDWGDPFEFFLSAVSEPLAFPLLLHNIRKPCCLARSRTQGPSSIKRFRVIACPVLETTLTCARPLRGDKNMKTMTAQKMNATGGIQAGGKCWTLQIEPPTAKTQCQWRKKHENNTFLSLYTTIGEILLCNTSLCW